MSAPAEVKGAHGAGAVYQRWHIGFASSFKNSVMTSVKYSFFETKAEEGKCWAFGMSVSPVRTEREQSLSCGRFAVSTPSKNVDAASIRYSFSATREAVGCQHVR